MHYLIGILFVVLLGLSFINPQPVLAHIRVEIGPYVVLVGWVEEPVIVGERNALLIEVTKDETPINGLEGTLEVQVLYAGRTFLGNLSPSGTPGLYEVEIFPTVRGQYQVHLLGSIEEMEVDQVVEPEEVLSSRVLQFPETQPEPIALQNTIDELQGQLQTAYTLAIVGIVVGVLGLGGAVFSLFRGRKST